MPFPALFEIVALVMSTKPVDTAIKKTQVNMFNPILQLLSKEGDWYLKPFLGLQGWLIFHIFHTCHLFIGQIFTSCRAVRSWITLTGANFFRLIFCQSCNNSVLLAWGHLLIFLGRRLPSRNIWEGCLNSLNYYWLFICLIFAYL